MYKVNDQLVIEKMNDYYCLVQQTEQKIVEMCFYSVADALAYSVERKYLK